MLTIEKHLRVEMPDGIQFDIPIKAIARNHAKAHKDKHGGSSVNALLEHTIPLFECDVDEILDWATNNINWGDVAEYAIEVPRVKENVLDYEKGWLNGAKIIVEKGNQ